LRSWQVVLTERSTKVWPSVPAHLAQSIRLGWRNFLEELTLAFSNNTGKDKNTVNHIKRRGIMKVFEAKKCFFDYHRINSKRSTYNCLILLMNKTDNLSCHILKY
jgi:hypothetical protein